MSHSSCGWQGTAKEMESPHLGLGSLRSGAYVAPKVWNIPTQRSIAEAGGSGRKFDFCSACRSLSIEACVNGRWMASGAPSNVQISHENWINELIFLRWMDSAFDYPAAAGSQPPGALANPLHSLTNGANIHWCHRCQLVSNRSVSWQVAAKSKSFTPANKLQGAASADSNST